MSKISPDDVAKVADLARLNLSKEDIKNYAGQLEKIIGYISQLEKVDTSGIEPTTRAIEVLNVVREDKVFREDIKEALLEQGPEREGDFFRVPKII